MKKQFVDPELNTLLLLEDDILTVSGGDSEGGGETNDGAIGLPGIDF